SSHAPESRSFAASTLRLVPSRGAYAAGRDSAGLPALAAVGLLLRRREAHVATRWRGERLVAPELPTLVGDEIVGELAEHRRYGAHGVFEIVAKRVGVAMTAETPREGNRPNDLFRRNMVDGGFLHVGGRQHVLDVCRVEAPAPHLRQRLRDLLQVRVGHCAN